LEQRRKGASQSCLGCCHERSHCGNEPLAVINVNHAIVEFAAPSRRGDSGAKGQRKAKDQAEKKRASQTRLVEVKKLRLAVEAGNVDKRNMMRLVSLKSMASAATVLGDQEAFAEANREILKMTRAMNAAAAAPAVDGATAAPIGAAPAVDGATTASLRGAPAVDAVTATTAASFGAFPAVDGAMAASLGAAPAVNGATGFSTPVARITILQLGALTFGRQLRSIIVPLGWLLQLL
jgi:hypothetical protein